MNFYGSQCHSKLIDENDFPMTLGEAYCVGEMEEDLEEFF